jgi:hypothetical protein
MANHFEIRSTEKITPDFINKHINEYVDKWMFGLFDVEYTDSSNIKNHTNWGDHVWVIKSKTEDEYRNNFFFWINDEDNLEFRHAPKTDFFRWLEFCWFEYIAKKIKNPQLYDEGIGYFGFENIVDKYNGWKDYKKAQLNNYGKGGLIKDMFNKRALNHWIKDLPKEYHIFLEDYKEKVHQEFRNKNIDNVVGK